MHVVTKLASSISLDALNKDQVSHRLLKRVKLSDSAMGLIMQLGITCVRSRDWYPLSLSASGYALAQPLLKHMGYAHEFPGELEGPYDLVLKDELPALRKACEDVYPATMTDFLHCCSALLLFLIPVMSDEGKYSIKYAFSQSKLEMLDSRISCT